VVRDQRDPPRRKASSLACTRSQAHACGSSATAKLDGVAGDPRLWSSSGGVWQSAHRTKVSPRRTSTFLERELKPPVCGQGLKD
jgi:hypothetical protein